MATVICSVCAELLALDGQDPPPDDHPCPSCGSTGKHLIITPPSGSLGLEGIPPELVMKSDPARSAGHVANPPRQVATVL